MQQLKYDINMYIKWVIKYTSCSSVITDNDQS